MYLASRWLFRNLTRLELVAAWIVLLLLIGGFARYTLGVFARAEQSMISRTVNNIDTALKYHFGMAVMQNDIKALGKLKNINPMEIMQGLQEDYFLSDAAMKSEELASGYPFLSRPASYGGVIRSGGVRELEKGKWYYDPEEHILIYLVRNSELYRGGSEGPARIRFRMDIIYNDVNQNNEFDPGVDEYQSVRMLRMDDSGWTT